MPCDDVLETNEITQNKTLPEAFGLSHWNEDEIMSYTVLKTFYPVPRDKMNQMVREFWGRLESICGLHDEIHWTYRIEGGHYRYITSTVRDPSITRTHAHVLIGKHKITNSIKHPERDFEWFRSMMVGEHKPWHHGEVYCMPYVKNIRGPLPNGAVVYNCKAPKGRCDKEWDDMVVTSRMLTRHLVKLKALKDSRNALVV